eukprot:633003-Prymnesium_polylepis.1
MDSATPQLPSLFSVLDTIVDNDDDAHAPADFIRNYLAEHAKQQYKKKRMRVVAQCPDCHASGQTVLNCGGGTRETINYASKIQALLST